METAHPLAAPAQAPAAPLTERDRIVIGTPCYGGQCCEGYMRSILDVMLYLGAEFAQEGGTTARLPLVTEVLTLTNESHIDRARNKIANRFMRGKADYLLFIDSDIIFSRLEVARLWSHMRERGHRLVCGGYAMKGIVPQFALSAVPGAKPDEHGLVQCMHSGTGFMMVHRDVFLALERAGLAPEYVLGSNDPDRAEGHTTARQYFKSGLKHFKEVNGSLWLSEDYMFCAEWRECGGRVWVDRGINLEHVGAMTFPPHPQEVAAAYKRFMEVGAYDAKPTPADAATP
jgi:hypothetical protein